MIDYLVNSRQNFLSNLLATLEVVITIRENFRLNNWDDSGALANGGITSENIGVLEDGQFAWASILDLQHAPPLGEMTSVFLVLNATRLQIVESLGGALIFSAKQWHDTLVNFDSGQHVAFFHQLDKGSSIVGLLVESLVEQNHTGDVLANYVLYIELFNYIF